MAQLFPIVQLNIQGTPVALVLSESEKALRSHTSAH